MQIFPKTPKFWQITLILGVGVFAISMSAIFIRLTLEITGFHGVGFSLFLSASRLIIATFMLLPIWRGVRQTSISPKAFYYAGIAGLCLAFHIAFWISSLSFTSITAATTLVTTNPIWIAILSRFWFQEKLRKLTILGIVIALLGGIAIALGGMQGESVSSQPLLGDILALIGAWFVSFYLLLGRESQRQGLSTSHYITIAYTIAAIALFPFPFFFGFGYLGYPLSVYFYVLLMAVFSQVIGHTTINWAVRWMSPVLVSLIILFEPVGSSILGYFVFGELPSSIVILGAIIILVGVAISIIGERKKA
ncbi:DMT family transporter [Spirulina sp. 06S082]|uniref:DMT family transporter n=1 Tax=Spirulina sp. 06S082 TaxID=3110248 RepID=UPI002B200072|nr:DMT family transporter [Spirulina sp. 06S082]MEA5471464.1 DMT family transporter [Spirulina sp. 06S082]